MSNFLIDTKKRRSLGRSFEVLLDRQLGGDPRVDWQLVERLVAEGEADCWKLYDAGAVPAGLLADVLALHHGLPRIEAAGIEMDEGLLQGLSRRFLQSAWALPVRHEGMVCLAVADPSREEDIAAMRMALADDAPLVVASFDALAVCFESLAQSFGAHPDSAGPAPMRGGEEVRERLEDIASGAPIVEAVEDIFETALMQGATDIHVEPTAGGARIRLRVDGLLRTHRTLDAQTGRGIVSRIKILSGLDIAERRLPQDGRARIAVGKRELDVRVATAPALHGETLVMRLLIKDAASLDMGRLGMNPADLAVVRRALVQPHGIIVVTGPTGSGKTTTLTAALTTLNTPERKIMTIEDPVEYQITGIIQTQVRPAIDLTFANALRSFLRHDPDILMVGEMRDTETASIAVQAALTGHLVLTTAHTNSAADAITRLIDLGVESFLLNSALRCIVGQRLVRKLCEHCRREETERPTRAGEYLCEKKAEEPASARYFSPGGCAQCGQTGFRGRTGLFEVLPIDGRMRELIRHRATTGEIESAAIAAGMTTMLQDGYLKSAAGITSFDEVLRVTS